MSCHKLHINIFYTKGYVWSNVQASSIFFFFFIFVFRDLHYILNVKRCWMARETHPGVRFPKAFLVNHGRKLHWTLLVMMVLATIVYFGKRTPERCFHIIFLLLCFINDTHNSILVLYSYRISSDTHTYTGTDQANVEDIGVSVKQSQLPGQ